MTPSLILQIGRETIFVALMVLAPIFVVGFVIGITVSLVQAVLQIQDATIGIIPKIVGIAASLLIFGNWMLGHLMTYCQRYLGEFTSFIQ